MVLIEFQKLQASIILSPSLMAFAWLVHQNNCKLNDPTPLLALPTQGKDIVFRFITEYNSLRAFGP